MWTHMTGHHKVYSTSIRMYIKSIICTCCYYVSHGHWGGHSECMHGDRTSLESSCS